MTDWGYEAQLAAEKHYDACEEALWAEIGGEEDVESPAIGAYCGCTTCIVREILTVAWPIFEESVADA